MLEVYLTNVATASESIQVTSRFKRFAKGCGGFARLQEFFGTMARTDSVASALSIYAAGAAGSSDAAVTSNGK